MGKLQQPTSLSQPLAATATTITRWKCVPPERRCDRELFLQASRFSSGSRASI
jgi:hypothetical protein